MTTLVLVSIAAFISTLVGGFFALRFKDKLHLILGFSAGAVIAVAFFDLIPEALELGKNYYEMNTIMTLVAVGFILYLILDRTIFSHSHEHDHDHEFGSGSFPEEGHGSKRGILGAGTLCLHSFFDGLAIGFAFQVSSVVGVIVTVAVLVHDFSDGINTVNFIVKNRGKTNSAFKWLVMDAFAPVLGIIATLFVVLPESALSVILALFAGFFLYLGASDLIPESQHAHPKFMTTLMTVLGALVLYGAITVAGM